MNDTQQTEDRALWPPVDPFKAGLACVCPRCGQGKLYDGVLTVKPVCAACGLDNSFADAGDGPAVFVIMIVGFVILGLALWLEFNVHPPLFVHVIVWIPLTFGLSIWLLRVLKAMLIALQYRNDARPGEIDRG